VREYISLIDSASIQSHPHLFLSKCRLLLLQIYTLGIQLPDVEPQDNEVSKIDYPSPMSSIGILLGKYDMYNEVFDPIKDGEIVAASLSDDLAGIYRDLKDPLLDYDSDKREDAIWSWKFNIQGHCGDHLVDSLRAIHRLVNLYIPTGYDSDANGS
jgi:hypothetical protein